MNVNAHMKETLESLLAPFFTMWGYKKKTVIYNSEESPH